MSNRFFETPRLEASLQTTNQSTHFPIDTRQDSLSVMKMLPEEYQKFREEALSSISHRPKPRWKSPESQIQSTKPKRLMNIEM